MVSLKVSLFFSAQNYSGPIILPGKRRGTFRRACDDGSETGKHEEESANLLHRWRNLCGNCSYQVLECTT